MTKRARSNAKTTRATKHPFKKLEVSIMGIQDPKGRKFKVTRRLPEMSVAETMAVNDKKKAKKLFDEWLK